MGSLVNSFIGSGENDYVHLAVTALLVVLVVLPTYIKLRQSPDWLRRSRVTKLAEAVACKSVGGITRKHLEAELEKEHFGIATGLYLEKEIREPFIRMHQRLRGKVEFFHFKEAYKHIEPGNPEAPILISCCSHAAYWLINLASHVCFLAASILILAVAIVDLTAAQIFQHLFMGFCFAFASVILVSQTRAVNSAKHIKKQIEIADKKNTIDNADSLETET